MMKVGIISDTHDNVDNVLKAVDVFKQNGCELVFHCGDIVAPGTVKFFEGLNIKFVKGNCDGDLVMIKEWISKINGEWLGDVGEVSVSGKTIGIYHGNDVGKLEGMVNSKKYDYIFTGHTHQTRDEKIGSTRVINPGAHYYKSENKVVVLEIDNDDVEFIPL